MKIQQYAIVIFPKFENEFHIQQIRDRYDPLAVLIDPHITLVFPHESDFPIEQLRTHIQHAIQGIRPFEVYLQGITGSESEYLFLNIKVGNDQIIKLHDRLYSGLLESHLKKDHTYIPHLTVGRLNDQSVFITALETAQNLSGVFTTVIKEISLIRVGENYPIEAHFNFTK